MELRLNKAVKGQACKFCKRTTLCYQAELVMCYWLEMPSLLLCRDCINKLLSDECRKIMDLLVEGLKVELDNMVAGKVEELTEQQASLLRAINALTTEVQNLREERQRHYLMSKVGLIQIAKAHLESGLGAGKRPGFQDLLKIPAIKFIKTISNLGLKESKDVVDEAVAVLVRENGDQAFPMNGQATVSFN